MFSPDEFIGVGESLRKGTGDSPVERRFRTTISRAYYAAYLTAREVIRNARAEPAYDVEHGALAKFLRDHSDQTVGRFGQELYELFRRRTLSDYDLHRELKEQEEQVSLLSAKSLISRAPAVLNRVQANTFPRRSQF